MNHLIEPESAALQIGERKEEILSFLTSRLLPFWIDRCEDRERGGFITHFDKEGKDSLTDEKSLISQTRTIFSLSAAARAGFYRDKCLKLAAQGVDYLLEKMWDRRFGGFYWMTDRKGSVMEDKKIIYGQSFAIYALSEYAMASGDKRGADYAVKTYDLLMSHAYDDEFGGFLEMFHRDWSLCGPGPEGGDRKTLDVHMHLMESLTSLYECTGEENHRGILLEVIDLHFSRILHKEFKTGIPQFFRNWEIAPQIKFNIVWGLDRFDDSGIKPHAEDNTSAGHNAEFVWLLIHALKILKEDTGPYKKDLDAILTHVIRNGLDREYGGIYVEGPHSGGVSDREKEFWQQLEAMTGLLDGYLLFNEPRFWDAYKSVHSFLFGNFADFKNGEFRPLLTREGAPIWSHLGNSWKTSYHSIRAMLECLKRLEELQRRFGGNGHGEY